MQIVNFLSLFAILVATANADIIPGQYIINNPISGQLMPIGRALREDRSLLPKPVRYGDLDEVDPKWLVSPAANGAYFLINKGWSVGEVGNLLWGCAVDSCSEQTWAITPAPQGGPDAYIVTNVDKSGGWVIPEDVVGTQIAVRPLIAGPSYPPYYPPNEIFIFTPLLD